MKLRRLLEIFGFLKVRYLAINRVMAEFMPQSLSCAKRFGAITAIASMPILEGDSSLARNMMPNADMIVEIIKP